MKIHKIVIGYWLELLLGAFVFFVIDNIGLDFFFLLLVILISSELRINHLRATMRVFQVANECKIIAITKHLGITENELEKIGNEIEKNLTENQSKSLQEDFRIVGMPYVRTQETDDSELESLFEDTEDQEKDSLYEEAKKITMERNTISVAALQKELQVGYPRASHLIDVMEEEGIISKADGMQPRKVLKNK